MRDAATVLDFPARQAWITPVGTRICSGLDRDYSPRTCRPIVDFLVGDGLGRRWGKARCAPTLLGGERRKAGHTHPALTATDPRVREALPQEIRLPVFHAIFAIHTVDDGSRTIKMYMH